MIAKYSRSIVCALTLFTLLSGCNPLPPIAVPPTAHYTLNQTPKAQWQATKPSKILLIAVPQVDAYLHSTHMWYSKKTYELEAFAHNEWSTPPAHMLQNLMAESLAHTHAFFAVLKTPFIGQHDLRLETNLQNLQQEFSNKQSHSHLRMTATLVNSHSQNIIASQQFESSVPAAINTPYGGVLAANQATHNVLKQLNRFVIAHVNSEAHLAKPAPSLTSTTQLTTPFA